MRTLRNTIISSASLLIGTAMLSAQAAPLPAGTVLTIDPGVNNTTSPICYTGSCFRINIPTLPGHVYDYNFAPGTDGGIVIGKNQSAGVSPATGDLAGFVSVQNPAEAPGSMYTTPYTFDPTDSSANLFDDKSCTSSSACAGKTVLGTWNRIGGTGLMFNMGSAAKVCTSTFYCPGVTKWTITAAGAAGIDGDRYVLEYQRTNPDVDGYDQVYTFHLEGTIHLPKVVGVDVAATLIATPNPATQNATLTYTATLANFGTQTATGVGLSDLLPVGVNFVSATPSQGNCTFTAAISCALGDLTSGANATVQIAVIPTITGTLTNSISVTSIEADVNTINNTANSSVVVNTPLATADLGVTMTGSPNPVKRLSNLTYTVQVKNSGPNAASSVTVKDILPSSMRFVSASANQGTCSGSSTVTCLLGTLASGANASVTIVVQPRSTGTYTNKVSVSSTTLDNNTSNNSTSVSTTVKYSN